MSRQYTRHTLYQHATDGQYYDVFVLDLFVCHAHFIRMFQSVQASYDCFHFCLHRKCSVGRNRLVFSLSSHLHTVKIDFPIGNNFSFTKTAKFEEKKLLLETSHGRNATWMFVVALISPHIIIITCDVHHQAKRTRENGISTMFGALAADKYPRMHLTNCRNALHRSALPRRK